MITNTIIVDNFLDYPDKVRESVLTLDFHRTGPYPGLRSDHADLDYQNYVQTKIEHILNLEVTEWVQDSFCFQICLDDVKTWIHHDDSEWAGILYLSKNPPVGAGTGIYRHIPTGISTNSPLVDIEKEEEWELVTAIGNVYNRLALYRADLYHKSLIAGFGNSIETGRLTQTFFFNTKTK